MVELQNPRRSVTAQEGFVLRPNPGQRSQPWVVLKELEGTALLAMVCVLLIFPQETKQ